jgi:hypothetical protein
MHIHIVDIYMTRKKTFDFIWYIYNKSQWSKLPPLGDCVSVQQHLFVAESGQCDLLYPKVTTAFVFLQSIFGLFDHLENKKIWHHIYDQIKLSGLSCGSFIRPY